MTEQTKKQNDEWETFFVWWPMRLGRHYIWLRNMQRAKAYFTALNDDPGPFKPVWVYRYPVKVKS